MQFSHPSASPAFQVAYAALLIVAGMSPDCLWSDFPLNVHDHKLGEDGDGRAKGDWRPLSTAPFDDTMVDVLMSDMYDAGQQVFLSGQFVMRYGCLPV